MCTLVQRAKAGRRRSALGQERMEETPPGRDCRLRHPRSVRTARALRLQSEACTGIQTCLLKQSQAGSPVLGWTWGLVAHVNRNEWGARAPSPEIAVRLHPDCSLSRVVGRFVRVLSATLDTPWTVWPRQGQTRRRRRTPVKAARRPPKAPGEPSLTCPQASMWSMQTCPTAGPWRTSETHLSPGRQHRATESWASRGRVQESPLCGSWPNRHDLQSRTE